jgi:hypothetical protein
MPPTRNENPLDKLSASITLRGLHDKVVGLADGHGLPQLQLSRELTELSSRTCCSFPT